MQKQKARNYVKNSQVQKQQDQNQMNLKVTQDQTEQMLHQMQNDPNPLKCSARRHTHGTGRENHKPGKRKRENMETELQSKIGK